MPHGASSNLQAVAGRSFPWSTFEVTKDVSIAGVDQPLESRVIVGLQPKRGPKVDQAGPEICSASVT